jgi:hypothetical protein
VLGRRSIRRAVHLIAFKTNDDEDTEDMASSKQSSGADSKSDTTGNASIPAQAMNVLSDTINSLFGGLYGPETSTQSGQEREDDPARDSAVLADAAKAKYYEHVSVEELEGRIKGLKARLKRNPPEAMKKAIPVLIAELEAELDKKGCQRTRRRTSRARARGDSHSSNKIVPLI